MMRVFLVASVPASALEWTLGMQLCPDATEWTLHGLWPNTDDCKPSSFDEHAISSIESQLEAKWSSCYGKGAGDEDFWQHEWQKHGTCSGMDELTYFNTALALQAKYNHLCSGWKDKHACELPCTGTTADDIQCSAPDPSAPVPGDEQDDSMLIV
jgi:hypothetical protein